MSLLGLPELELSENLVRYADQTNGPRRVRITHSWMERTGWYRPLVPSTLMPADGATAEPTFLRMTATEEYLISPPPRDSREAVWRGSSSLGWPKVVPSRDVDLVLSVASLYNGCERNAP